LLFLISSYYTLNRTVWLGLMVEALLVGALVLRRRRLVDESPLGTTMKLAAAAGAALIVGVGAALMLNVHAERESAVDPAAGTKDSRVELWRESMAWIAERPLTGHGFGRGLLRDELRAKLHGINLWHAHNYFLDTVVQTGVPGLLLFVLLLAAMVRAGWRMSRDADLGIAACGIALLCIVAGMAVRNMTDTLLVRQNALLFWGLAGVLLAWGSKAPRA
jgi:O-antigen ligase